MQVSMEVLAQMMTRADSGANVRRKTPIDANVDPLFEKMLDGSRIDFDRLNAGETGRNGEIHTDDARQKTTQKPDDDPDENEVLAAGAMGYQNMVVFILEGDMESATDPELSAIAVQPSATDPIRAEAEEIPADAETDTAVREPEQAEQDTAGAEAAKTEPATIAAADVKNALNADKAPVADPADAGDENKVVMGEVTARRPVIRTSEKQENKDNDSGFSKNGDLSPLENGNDAFPVKGQKEKKYSENEEAARSAAKTAPDNTDSISAPVVRDVIPDRFQAGQQMRRTSDAPVKTENLFEEMVARIETMQTDERRTMSIQLKPEFLGKVALEIAMDAAGMHVKISAADSDVRVMLNSQINALIESLTNKGIEVAEVEVAYTGVDNGDLKDSNNDRARPDSSRRSYRADRVEEGAAFYAALQLDPLEYYLDAGVSSVEYRV